MTLVDGTERALLVARATELARRPAAAITGEVLNLVAFRRAQAARDRDALLPHVIRLRQLSPVPGAPPAVPGDDDRARSSRGPILRALGIIPCSFATRIG